MIYQESDLVRIAQRENNSRRNYLVVNRLQGKHIPVQPQKALEMFSALADTLKEPLKGERLLVIGFAETATAIGAAVAVELGAFYMQTTREYIKGAGYLFFSEEHSHAAEQKLVKDDLDAVIPKTDRILFVEDEVTTGKTILNIIDVLEKEYPKQISYAVASVLNGMNEDALRQYRSRQIPLYYLVKTNHEAYSEQAEQYSEKGEYIVCTENRSDGTKLCESLPFYKEFSLSGRMDARRLVLAKEYEQACMHLWREIDAGLHQELSGRVLVLGTEEFMYPALLAADRIAKKGAEVWFHATTRSPIAVYQEAQYPLHVRYELQSLYDRDRRTFVYDLGAYDTVLIITDAHNGEQEGVCSLIRAAAVSNGKICLVRWTGQEKEDNSEGA